MTIRKAAAIILVRQATSDIEVLLAGRNRSSSFMSRAYVFPGGAAEVGEDLRNTAIRELYEEVGILLTKPPVAQEVLGVVSRGKNYARDLTKFTLTPDVNSVHYYSRWITPSIESRRFDATFFVASCPEMQWARADDAEVVDAIWISPDAALKDRKKLRLPPPQIRTLHELSQYKTTGDLFAAATKFADSSPIMPKAIAHENGRALALPWDKDYEDGNGEGLEVADDHPHAWGPSRFILTDNGWKHE